MKSGKLDVWRIGLEYSFSIAEFTPCEERLYSPLPKELRNPMKQLINFQRENNESFRQCLVRYLTAAKTNPAKIKNVDRKLENNLI